ncbi:MAG: SMC-Scp complex subunit ScpB [Planctomycetota bacterium]|nr:SMC-Scp complex subunit ScpB [Planctomycetota bacterium]
MDAPQPSPSVEQPPADASLAAHVEAALMCADRPLPPTRLAEAVGLLTPAPDDAPAEGTRARVRDQARDGALAQIEECVEALNTSYERTGRSFRIEKVAGGLRVLTLPAFAPTIAALHRARQSSRLSRQGVETLAIIAYRQPVTRAQLEAIRGVSCGEVLKNLIERRLVTVQGRAEELGRPLLYATTRSFLDAFGLASLQDLPTIAELKPKA